MLTDRPPKTPPPGVFVDSDTDTLTLDADQRGTGLTILYHPRPDRIGERALLIGFGGGSGQSLARQEPLFAQPASALGRPLGTKRLSRRPIWLASTSGGGARLDPAGSRTAVEVDGTPLLGPLEIEPEQLEKGVVLLLGQMIVLALHRLEPTANDQLPHYGLIGESPGILKIRQDIDRVAELELPILIQGEPGTGQRAIAESLHRADGSRRDGPFVVVDASAPELDLEDLSAAFGRAGGGSLFLQNLDEADGRAQGFLLDLLPRVQSTGADRVRLLSSSDSNLELAASMEQFSSELFRAACGFIVHTVPVRERREDFGRLLHSRLAEELERQDEPPRLESWDPPWLPASIWAYLARRPWPGNLDQLDEVCRRLVEDNPGREQVLELTALDDV